MATIGLSAALEQFHPNELLEHSKLAEQHGFKGVMAADHFQPWVPAQGHNAFAYSWMGALGAVTNHTFGPGVTCPTFRTHPSVIAHAAATLGAMYPGRFWLGLGSGELLNENVVGGTWPEPLIRFEMLQEATEIIQKLLSGKEARFRGQYFQMNKVKLWTLPEQPVPVYIAATGPQTLRWAGRVADGLITPGAAPDKLKRIVSDFATGAREAGKDPDKMPRLLQIHVSWAETYEEALQSAITEWPNGGMNFPKQDIRSPEDFAAMAKLVRAENFKGRVLISADLDEHRAQLQSYIDLGFNEIYVHNVGRNQEQWIRAFGEHVLPKLK
jgi:coenzyme F420-dependent glucose-6-phosphate dehydrogenase